MTLSIKGRVISKKNSKRVFARGRRVMVLPSKRYVEFEKDALSQLLSQTTDDFMPYSAEVYMDYEFRMKGKGASDADNMIASINDVVQKAGILTDDKLVRAGSFRIIGDQPEYLTTVSITYL